MKNQNTSLFYHAWSGNNQAFKDKRIAYLVLNDLQHIIHVKPEFEYSPNNILIEKKYIHIGEILQNIYIKIVY